MWRTPSLSRILVALMVAGFTATLLAASPHYKRGGKPVCTIDTSDGSASCTSGLVAGLGNDDIHIEVTVTASAGTLCHNPGNSLEVPGQNPATGSGSGSVDIDAGAIKNGTATIPAVETEPVVFDPVTAETAGCPNGNWTATVDQSSVSYSGFYSFQQPEGNQINSLSFAF
jgi:hypothetical protein